LSQSIKLLSDAYTMTGDEEILVTSATVILPSPPSVVGKTFTIKDGQVSVSLSARQAVQLVSDGSNWLIVAKA
jgi:hypothetical protein